MKTNNILYPVILIICIVGNICLSFTPALAISRVRLALFTDKGAHPSNLLCTNLANDKSISTTYITGDDICNDCLKDFDVLFFPGGSGKREALSLTPEGQKKVRLFVSNGGIYLGVCAGCYLASCARPEYLGLFPMTTIDKEHWRRGKATLPIEFTKLGMEVFGLQQAKANVVYHNGPVLQAYKQYADNIATLSYYRGEIVAPGGEAGVMVNAPAMVLAQYGDGLVLGISPHPEATPGLTTIELTAIQWLYNHRPVNKQSLPATNSSHTNNLQVSTKASLLMDSNRATIQPMIIQPVVSRRVSGEPMSGERSASRLAATQVNSSRSIDRLSTQIYNVAENIFENTINSHYQHVHEDAEQQIKNANGKYKIKADCSGFVSYVIDTVSPKHYAVISQLSSRSYPHAQTYARFFSELPTNEISDGWQRISDYAELKRGDIIAWERPNRQKQTQHRNTGHVMIVIDKPGKAIYQSFKGQTIKYVEVYVLDSSSVEHFPPQSLPPLCHSQFRDGVGKGTIRLILDDQNNVIGFWEGTFSHERNDNIKGPSYTNKIAFARLAPLF